MLRKCAWYKYTVFDSGEQGNGRGLASNEVKKEMKYLKQFKNDQGKREISDKDAGASSLTPRLGEEGAYKRRMEGVIKP